MTSTARPALESLGMPTHPYVLLVDDHRPTLRQLQQVVELAGHPCVSATSARQAVDACERRVPQVVITDLAMPQLSGRGLGRLMKSRYPGVPLILVTGEAIDDDAMADLSWLFSGVYEKPVDVPTLIGHVERVMTAAENAPGIRGRT
jgi:DNA-binding NtrC family response regulator